MAQYTIKIEGGAELAARLRRFGTAVLDLSSSMDKTGTYLTNFFSGEVFASRGRVFGHPWAPLNSEYAVQKAREWPGRPPLIRTGLMNRSFRKNAGRLSVEVSNDVWYSQFHQEGTRRIPARMMIDLDMKREQRIVEFIEQDINGHMRSTNV